MPLSGIPWEQMPWEMVVYGTNTDLYRLLQWFFVYSILGWLVESIYMSLCARPRHWVNRGFIFGPICPIYGFGALGVYFLLRPFSEHLMLVYLAGAFLATGFEFLVATMLLHLFGEVWWDYHEKPFNYKGILCLESTLAWGVYTVVMFYFLQGAIEKVTALYPKWVGYRLVTFLTVYYFLDFGMHVIFARYPETPEKMRDIRKKIINR